MYEMDGVPMDGVSEDGMPETDGRRNEPSQPSCTAVATSTTLAEISRILSFSKTCTTLAEILLSAWLNKHEEALDTNGMPSLLTIATCLSLSFKWLGEHGNVVNAALSHIHCSNKDTRVFSAIWLAVRASPTTTPDDVARMHAANIQNGMHKKMRSMEFNILCGIDWKDVHRQLKERELHAQENSTACPARVSWK